MPTIVQGDLGTAASLGVLSNSIVVQMEDEIFLLEPNRTGLTMLANRVSRRSEGRSLFEWLEDERTPETTQVSGSQTAGDTTIEVDNPDYADVNSTARNQRTGEVVLITAVNASDWTVTRSWGGTAAAAMNDNDTFTILGGTAAEGADPEDSRATQLSRNYNYMEIVRDPFGVSRSLMHTETYGGDRLSYLQRARGIEHAVKLELKAWFQERNEDTSGNYPRRSMGGIDEVITTTRKNFGGNLTLVELFDWSEDAHRYGSDTKVLFCSRSVTSAISLLAAGRLQTVPSTETFGMNVKELLTPHGRWLVVTHDLFTGNQFANRAYSIDLANIGWRYLEDSDTKLTTNIQSPGADLRKDEFLTEAGIVRKQEQTHAAGLSMA